jgi:hypothetical protein
MIEEVGKIHDGLAEEPGDQPAASYRIGEKV